MIRKRKLKFIQITLIILGFIIIFLTYSQNYQNGQRKEILSKDAKNKISTGTIPGVAKNIPMIAVKTIRAHTRGFVKA